MSEAFALQKLLTFFNKKYWWILDINLWNFNETLTIYLWNFNETLTIDLWNFNETLTTLLVLKTTGPWFYCVQYSTNTDYWGIGNLHLQIKCMMDFVALLFYVNSKQLWSRRDCQLT